MSHQEQCRRTERVQKRDSGCGKIRSHDQPERKQHIRQRPGNQGLPQVLLDRGAPGEVGIRERRQGVDGPGRCRPKRRQRKSNYEKPMHPMRDAPVKQHRPYERCAEEVQVQS